MTTILSTSAISGLLRREVRRAAVLGMSQETRDAWNQLVRRLSGGPMTLLGAPGQSRVLLDRARRAGALEGSLDDSSAPTRQVVIPLTGATPAQRKRWKDGGYELVDLTLPTIRRAHVTLNLLKAEGCRLVLVGHPGDPECLAIAGNSPQVAVVDSVDEANDLPFAPQSGVVFQTSISSQRARTITEALRNRHRDSRVQILDTLSTAGLQREQALRNIARDSDLLLIIADPADASGRALYETARWLGRPAKIIHRIDDLEATDLRDARRIGLSAGEFTTDEEVDQIEAFLIGR
jgi:4-hydroxy-3-methylbut-2-enyl diphosphate reductase